MQLSLLSLFRGGERDPAAAQRRRRKRSAKRALAVRLRSDSPPGVLASACLAATRRALTRPCGEARLTEAILDYWWSLADVDADGVLVASEAVSFLSLSGLPREALARVWCVPRLHVASRRAPSQPPHRAFKASLCFFNPDEVFASWPCLF